MFKGAMFNQKKNFLVARITFCFLFFLFLIGAKAQDDAQLVIKGKTLASSRKKGLGLNNGIKSVEYKEESLEGANIEVKKNGATILKVTSGKKGTYSVQVPVSTTDSKNDFVVYVTKEGMAPKMILVNSFVAKEEFKKHSAATYEVELDLSMLFTSVTDIVLDKPSAKIKWDNAKEHKFTVDENYARSMLGEEQKMRANTDLYFSSLVKKKKKGDDALAKKKAAEEAKLKAIEDAKKKEIEDAQRLAELKAKEDADRLQREKDEAARIAALAQHKADSLADLERKKATETADAKTEVKEIKTPVIQIEKNDSKDLYDAAETYSLNLAQQSLRIEKEKRNREKGKNLTAKYETLNLLTSLLDVIDENDKKNRKQ